MNLINLNDIQDDRKIIRFIDNDAVKKSIGQVHGDELHYTFPIQLLSHYRRCEGVQQDRQEGSTPISGVGSCATTNEALVSCWSFWDGDDSADPWELLEKNPFVKFPYVIVSTVGKVKQQIQQIVDISDNFRDCHGGLILNAVYGSVAYYCNNGVNIEKWREKTDIKLGGDMQTIQNIFYKPLKHQIENECRFALIVNTRRFISECLSINAKDIVKYMVYHPLISKNISHYIDKVICFQENDSNSEVVSICYNAKVRISHRQESKVFVWYQNVCTSSQNS